MNGQNEAALATLVLYAINLLQFGIAREDIIDDVRAMEQRGAQPAEVAAYLKRLADAKLAELNAVQPPAA